MAKEEKLAMKFKLLFTFICKYFLISKSPKMLITSQKVLNEIQIKTIPIHTLPLPSSLLFRKYIQSLFYRNIFFYTVHISAYFQYYIYENIYKIKKKRNR